MADFLKLKKSNCKNCYKCIRHCPVKSIRFSGNQAHIVGNECILCGRCFVVCPQNAKEITDATETVKVLLAGDDPVYVSLAPSFIANYDDVGIEEMRRALKLLGFADVEETAIGATIVKREYERMLHEDKRDIVISSCCHSINLMIQKYFPGALQYLANVQSPMLAHCADIKRRHPGAKTVFIGPCLAKKDEADYYKGITDAVMTYDELTRWLEAEHITLEHRVDKTEASRARLFPTTGGILKTMACDEPGYSYIALDGIENCMTALRDIEAGKVHNCFIEMSACVGSCIGGPVMEKNHHEPVGDYIRINHYAGKEDFDVAQPAASSLHKSIVYIEKEAKYPSETEICSILRQMGKFKPSDELNCGSCGYDSCRAKAVAIYQGKADVSMCLPFLKDRAESFSDNVLNNTLNGIVVVNDKLEVQQINRAAIKMMNLRAAADVLGEPVVRILDPIAFLQVQNTGRSINDQLTFLAEYNRYVEQTIVNDSENHLLICFLRDVTEDQMQREKREQLNRKTIETADNVVEKQMRIVQEIASLLGETAAESKIALTKLNESIGNE